jgi:LacI family transcriptional regulator
LKDPGKEVIVATMQRTRKPRLSDVAAKARVSSATVSRALSNPQLVKPKTLQRINAVVRELGYVRDGLGRALASRRSNTAGVVVPTLRHSIFALAIQALQTRLAESDYQLLVASHEYSPLAEAAAVKSLIERGVDALLLVGTDHSREVWSMIDAATVPVILTWSLHDRIDSIGFDNERAGRLAAEHLLSLGHRRIGVVSGHLMHNDRAEARLVGVRAALAKAKLDLPTAYVSEHDFGLAGGRAGISALLALAAPPTAVIGGNDLLAIGAMLELQVRGRRVPEDMSVVGIDDLELAAHVQPALTTVRLPTYQLGTLAAEMTLRRLKGDATSNRIELPIDLVIRGTTGPAR